MLPHKFYLIGHNMSHCINIDEFFNILSDYLKVVNSKGMNQIQVNKAKSCHKAFKKIILRYLLSDDYIVEIIPISSDTHCWELIDSKGNTLRF